jgi:hypothetical protein
MEKGNVTISLRKTAGGYDVWFFKVQLNQCRQLDFQEGTTPRGDRIAIDNIGNFVY